MVKSVGEFLTSQWMVALPFSLAAHSYFKTGSHDMVQKAAITAGYAAVFLAMAVFAFMKIRSKSRGKKLALLKKKMTSTYALMGYEHITWSSYWPSYANLNFLESNDLKVTESFLRDRIKKIFEKNLWLTGRIITEGEGAAKKRKLIYDENVNLDEVINEYFFVGKPVKGVRAFEEGGDYYTMSKVMDPYRLPKANGTIDNPDGMLVRFVLFPIVDKKPGESNCILAMTLSHLVGDGYTFYAVYSMLSPKAPLLALNATRLEGFGQMYKQVMGKTVLRDFWPNSYLSLIGPFINRFLRHKTQVHVYEVDTNKEGPIADIKKKAAQEGRVEFVSTNDVITSAFFNAADCSYAGSTCNLRTLSPDKSHMLLAGNYSLPVVYRKPDYCTAALIRKSLKNDKASGRPLVYRAAEPPTEPPKMKNFISGDCSFFTSIAGPDPDLGIPGCRHVLWVPVPTQDDLGGYKHFAIMYKPRDGCLNMLGFWRDDNNAHAFKKAVGSVVWDARVSNPNEKDEQHEKKAQ